MPLEWCPDRPLDPPDEWWNEEEHEREEEDDEFIELGEDLEEDYDDLDEDVRI